ncbi:hypothetical protein BG015_003596 [Linnemannia schmuckeri]|uniref:Uncharacterized protein n=1 Tax=Linnemannia schmuckeri TaxID=64567 RepID=A0A9P5S335_9FUNG|nr:hypothetical protein BG015_003596 [Linnemannia schmuckeri]
MGFTLDPTSSLVKRDSAATFLTSLTKRGNASYNDWNFSTDKMENSAQQLKGYIDRVLTAMNATMVEMLGHSQEPLMLRIYMKNLGNAAKVHKFAALGAIQ